jgi:hypothetical protein
LLAVIVGQHGSQEVASAAIFPKIRRGFGQSDRLAELIREQEHAPIVGAEAVGPVVEAIEIAPGGPAFPGVARLFRRPAGEPPAFDVDEQLRPGRSVDDEVDALDGAIGQERPDSSTAM